MIVASPSRWYSLFFVAGLVGCRDGVTSVDVADAEALSYGNGQIAVVGSLLPIPLGIRAYDSQGRPQAGVTVRWTLRDGHGSVSPHTSVTDAAGEAFTSWKLGGGAGLQELVAEIQDVLPVRLQARALPGGVSQLRLTVRDSSTLPIPVGRTAAFRTESHDGHGNDILDRPVLWSSSDTTVLKTNSVGIATGVALGQAYVIASQDGVADSLDVTVVVAEAGGWVAVDAGGSGSTAFSCATRVDGEGYCWGNNFSGQLGTGTIVSTPIPAAVQGGHLFEEIRTGAGSSTFACGRARTGNVFCWGSAGPGIGAASPQTSLSPVEVTLPGTAIALDVGTSHACVVLQDGSVLCWGEGGSGELGNGALVGSARPVVVQLAAGTRLHTIAAGAASTCAVTENDEVICWGSGTHGQLGPAGNQGSAVPTLVPLPDGVEAVAVVAGSHHNCAVTAGDQMLCWGRNQAGQLGTGAAGQPSSQPLAVVSLSGISGGAAGAAHSCSMGRDGRIQCWGAGALGQIGDGGLTTRLEPVVPTMPAGVQFHRIAAGADHSCALTTAGEIYCWGQKGEGSLGNGTYGVGAVPVRVSDPPGI